MSVSIEKDVKAYLLSVRDDLLMRQSAVYVILNEIIKTLKQNRPGEAPIIQRLTLGLDLVKRLDKSEETFFESLESC